MIHLKDGMEDRGLHNTPPTITPPQSAVTDKSVEMLTENTASTSSTADNGTATTKQSQHTTTEPLSNYSYQHRTHKQ
jgi:hypothetical protein